MVIISMSSVVKYFLKHSYGHLTSWTSYTCKCSSRFKKSVFLAGTLICVQWRFFVNLVFVASSVDDSDLSSFCVMISLSEESLDMPSSDTSLRSASRTTSVVTNGPNRFCLYTTLLSFIWKTIQFIIGLQKQFCNLSTLKQ